MKIAYFRGHGEEITLATTPTTLRAEQSSYVSFGLSSTQSYYVYPLRCKYYLIAQKQNMDLPASYYGNLDKRNPVIIGFVREINSFIAVMKKKLGFTFQIHLFCRVKMLMEIWKKYKHRLPASLYQEHMLQVADALLQFKFHEIALWYGYSLHLHQYTSVDFLDIEDMDHFKSCYFPEGLDTDQDTLLMKVQYRQSDICTPDGLYKLLCVLDLIRLTMQVFQHYDSMCWQIYNGSVLVYNICRFLMTKNYSAQALEYLLWASFSIELSVPLMTSNTLPWLVTLYCAVCQCYYDNQAAVQGEIFARRALVKVNKLAKLEEKCGFPASKENRRAFKEASIKLVTMVFKRAVFEARTKTFRFKTKKKLSDIPNVCIVIKSLTPWPRSPTEQILSSLFEGGAAQFLGVLEALRDNSRSGETGGSEDLEGQEVILELLAAGICLLSGESKPFQTNIMFSYTNTQ
uniref:Uncharacterized protein n=1 Tax=Neogobius melanostomus TaxID=47308 RepID=A0A8C6SB42_9GOBI